MRFWWCPVSDVSGLPPTKNQGKTTSPIDAVASEGLPARVDILEARRKADFLRGYYDNGQRMPIGLATSANVIEDLCADVEFLRARLAAVEAQRDQLRDLLATTRLNRNFWRQQSEASDAELSAAEGVLAAQQKRIEELEAVPEIDRRVRARIETNRLRAAALLGDKPGAPKTKESTE